MTNQISTQTISFNNQALITFEQNGTYYTAMKPICENIGLAWNAQFERIKRDEILSQGMIVMIIVAEDGKQREMICLPIEYLNGWLFGIDVNRCKPEIRETLIKYKKECYQALHDYWFKGKAERKAKQLAPTTITAEEQQQIQNAVRRTHHRTGLSYQEIYHRLKVKFKIAKYDQLKREQHRDAMIFIASMQPDELPLSDTDIQEFINCWFATTRFHESVRDLMRKLEGFSSREQDSVHFNYSVCRKYFHQTRPIIERLIRMRNMIGKLEHK